MQKDGWKLSGNQEHRTTLWHLSSYSELRVTATYLWNNLKAVRTSGNNKTQMQVNS